MELTQLHQTLFFSNSLYDAYNNIVFYSLLSLM